MITRALAMLRERSDGMSAHIGNLEKLLAWADKRGNSASNSPK